MEHLDLSIDAIILAAITEHMRRRAPLIDTTYNDETLVNLVVKPLENLIFAIPHEGQRKVYESRAGALPMCTKFFKNHDTHYSCEECQNDSTCVMCEECFLHSAHVRHVYTTRRSVMEGGCCDCGDEEAWKAFPSCSLHCADSGSNTNICSSVYISSNVNNTNCADSNNNINLNINVSSSNTQCADSNINVNRDFNENISRYCAELRNIQQNLENGNNEYLSQRTEINRLLQNILEILQQNKTNITGQLCADSNNQQNLNQINIENNLNECADSNVNKQNVNSSQNIVNKCAESQNIRENIISQCADSNISQPNTNDILKNITQISNYHCAESENIIKQLLTNTYNQQNINEHAQTNKNLQINKQSDSAHTNIQFNQQLNNIDNKIKLITSRTHAFNVDFLQRLSEILKHLCYYITAVGDPEMAPMIITLPHIDMRTNLDHIFSILVFNDELHTYGDVIPCFEFCLNISSLEAENLAYSVNDRGFAIVKTSTDFESLNQICENITTYQLTDFAELPLKTKIVNFERIYHMRIASILTKYLYEFCTKKTEFCDLLSRTIFSHTTFVQNYVLNEPKLWKEFRHNIIYKIVYPVLYSEEGKLLISDFFLNNLEIIYKNYIEDDHSRTYYIINITVQFITAPSCVIRLVEKGLISRIINLFSQSLTDIGLKKYQKISPIFGKGKMAVMRLDRISSICDLTNETFCIKYEPHNWSLKFREEFIKAAKVFVQFCSNFDDMEPVKKIYLDVESTVEYEGTSNFFTSIISFLCNITRWILLDEEVAEITLRELYRTIKGEFMFDFLQKYQYNILCEDDLIERLITGPNALFDSISLHNISRRVFIDILFDFIINKRLPNDLHDSICKDKFFLLYIARPCVAALSLGRTYREEPFRRNSSTLELLFRGYYQRKYGHYTILQDFNIIQLMLTFIEPEIVIRFLIWNLYPVLREKCHFSNDIFSILPNENIDLREVLQLLYNGVSEWHFIGEHQDYMYVLLERQVIHYLAACDMSRKTLLKFIFEYRCVNNLDDMTLTIYLEKVLNKIASTKTFIHLDKRYSLRPEYLKQVNRFNFSYSPDLQSYAYDEICNLYRLNKYSFEIPDICNLNPEFIGIFNFIFSEAFMDLIMVTMLKFSYVEEKKDILSDDFEIAVMCLCFLLKLSKYSNIREKYKNFYENMHKPQVRLGNRTISEFLLDEQPKVVEVTVISVINYYFKLMKGEATISEELPSNPEKEKARLVKEEILKQMQTSQQRFLETNSEWLLFNENAKESLEIPEVEILTNCEDFTLHCESCRLDDDLNNLRTDVSKHDIFTFETDYVCLGFIKKTRRLRQSVSKPLPLGVDDIENECMSNPEFCQRFETLTSIDSDFILAGCSHYYHISCTNRNYWTPASLFHDPSSTFYCICQICFRNENFMIPVMAQIIKSRPLKISTFEIIKEYQRLTTDIQRDSAVNYYLETEEGFKKCDEFFSKIYKYDISVDEHNIHFINYSILLNITPLTDPDEIESLFYMRAIIQRTLSCLSASIINIEVISRESAVFHPDIVENTNFKALSEFARFCYNSSGLAPFLNSMLNDKPIIIKMLSFIYINNIYSVDKLHNIFTFAPYEVDISHFHYFLTIDHFSHFIYSFMISANIMALNFSTQEQIQGLEVNIAKVFYISIILKVMLEFVNNKRNAEILSDFSFPDEDICDLHNLFILLSGSNDNADYESKKYLYFLYSMAVLPFLRRVSILFYLIFDWKPNEILKSKCLDDVNTMKAMLSYLSIPSNFSSLLNDDEIPLLRNSFQHLLKLSAQNNQIINYRDSFYKNKISLVELPVIYLDLVIEHRHITCTHCSSTMKMSYKCLICGDVLPYLFSCQCPMRNIRDVLIDHTACCDGNDGVFIQINPPKIFYLQKFDLKMLHIPIYEDSFGESMFSSKSALRIAPERFKKLNNLYQRDQLATIPNANM